VVKQEGQVLESYGTKHQKRRGALKTSRKSMKRYGQPEIIVTNKLRSSGAGMKVIGNIDCQETGRWLNKWAKNSRLPFRRRRAILRFRRMRSYKRRTDFMPRHTRLAIIKNRVDTSHG